MFACVSDDDVCVYVCVYVCGVKMNSFFLMFFFLLILLVHIEREFVLLTSNVPFIKVGCQSFAVTRRVLYG